MTVLTLPTINSRSMTISGQKTPDGALVAVRPSTASLMVPEGTLVNSKKPCESVVTHCDSRPRMKTLAPTIGLRNTSSLVCKMPSLPAKMSSRVMALRSTPGSTTLPLIDVLGSEERLTVEKL